MKPETEFRKLLVDFPCFISEDTSFSSYCGFLRVKDAEFRVRLTADCSRFDADRKLRLLLKSSTKAVKSRLDTARTPHEFLLELREIIERELDLQVTFRQTLASTLPPVHYYEKLLSDISNIGWNCVEWMDDGMRELELCIHDSQERKHVIKLQFAPNYPTTEPVCLTSLPDEFELRWDRRDQGLQTVIDQFTEAVEGCQDFFRVMEDFDSHCWVLEPEKPSWQDTYRRLALESNASIRLEIDPRAPIRGFPECRFLGAETATGKVRQRLNERIHGWCMTGEVLPRENLENILQLTFPKPDEEDSKAEEEGHSLECGICYAYRFNDSVPDVACDRKECSKPYHRGCLIDWLRALPDTRESFGTITGNCVYCEHSISVSVKQVD